MKKTMLWLLCLMLLKCFSPAIAEEKAAVSVNSPYIYEGESVQYTISRPELMEKVIRELGQKRPAETPNRLNRMFAAELKVNGESMTVYYDDLYALSYLKQGDTFFLLDNLLGAELMYPARLWLDSEAGEIPEYEVRQDYVNFLAQWGWTPFFTLSESEITLPDQLTASYADDADLFFTWADVFLRAGGFDLSPWLGKTVSVTILGLWEKEERSRFVPSDLERDIHLPLNLRCVILHHEDTIIGAFLAPGRHDGAWMESVNGQCAMDILGDSDPTAYLIEKAALTEEEKELALASPEEVVRQFLLAPEEDTRVFSLRADALSALAMNLPDDQLFVSFAEQWEIQRNLLAEDGLEERWPARVQSISRLQTEENVYKAVTESGQTWYIWLEWESEQTGWKVKYCLDHYA